MKNQNKLYPQIKTVSYVSGTSTLASSDYTKNIVQLFWRMYGFSLYIMNIKSMHFVKTSRKQILFQLKTGCECNEINDVYSSRKVSEGAASSSHPLMAGATLR